MSDFGTSGMAVDLWPFFLVLLLEIAPVVDACSYFQLLIGFWWASQVALVVKNLSASAGP